MAELHTIYLDRPVPLGFDDIFAGVATPVGPEPDALVGADAALAGASVWDAARIESARQLKVISRTGIGYDTVDLDAATKAGIVVCNAPESPTISTAEHTMALLLHATKHLSANQARLATNAGNYYAANEGIELAGKTLGIVGHGRIGTRVARAAAALDMEVIAHDPYISADSIATPLVPLVELFERSHVISMHCPLTEETRGMIDTEAFAAMRDGVAFVNAARGGIVDQEALIAALDSGKVAAAGLDVTVPEPLPVSHPLQGRPNVMITPHIASATDLGRRRMYTHAVANAMTVLRGERPRDCVNPAVYH